MTWFKVDDTLAFHRKVVAAGNAAMGLWVRAGSICAQQLTDGFIPEHMVNVLGTPAQTQKLVSVGLWIEVPGGYQFHEWSEEGRQPEAQSVRERRRVDAERQAKWRAGKSAKSQVSAARNGVTPDGVTDGVTGGVTPAPTRPDPTRSSGYVLEDSLGDETSAKMRPLPDAWKPHAGHVLTAQHKRVDVAAEAVEFRAHALDKGRISADWNAAFDRWLSQTSTRSSGRPTHLRPVSRWANVDGDHYQGIG